GLVMLSVATLVLLGILPDAVHELGWLAYPLLVTGVLGPTVLEHSLMRLQHSAHRIVLILVALAIGLHKFTDGLALALPVGPVEHGIHVLPLAVVLHQIPAGIVTWWLLVPAYGRRVAVGSLVGMGSATVLGYFAEALVAPMLESHALAGFQAFVAGTLLHVAVHRWGLHADG
ncbi:MAG: ZIP family metal transporter, partial [Myxococcota bacterium]